MRITLTNTLLALMALAWTLCTPAQAATYKVLHSFCSASNCRDGYWPQATLLRDGAGNLYGTTLLGGRYGNTAQGGTIFRLSPHGSTWRFHVLHNFCVQAQCADGSMPQSKLIIDNNGNLYGTATRGGANDSGVVYRLTPNGRGGFRFKLLYTFCAVNGAKPCLDGGGPQGGLTYAGAETGLPYDGTSPLYGAVAIGGGGTPHDGGGAVYALSPHGRMHWTENVLHAFCLVDCSDGSEPVSRLLLDGAGNLFGTTYTGGDNDRGTVFELSPAGGGSWSYARLYSFCPSRPCTDGDLPRGALVMDNQGNLFGTTYTSSSVNGVLFKVVPNGSSSVYGVVHAFCGVRNCVDGKSPLADLFLDASGNIVATTSDGGPSHGGAIYRWDGTAMQGLYSFCSDTNCTGGYYSWSGVTPDPDGNLFGAALYGGGNGVINDPSYTAGVVYMLTP
ncbi:MAG TPA: choice-of-anchor tandem repeat GloVer-containing protein [Rhizomicrobium sp.]|nr:choice-of-anchor tandem repeat GloVer-containing protein [Rhizomicrobium sp.]